MSPNRPFGVRFASESTAESNPMTVDHHPHKPLSVSAMAELLGFSRQHFHVLINHGVFPSPVYDLKTRRPMYVGVLRERCLEVLGTGIGVKGEPVVFNETRRRRERRGRTRKRSSPSERGAGARARRLVDQLSYLDVPATIEQVTSALRAARAEGIEDDGPELLGYLVRHLGGDAPGAAAAADDG